MGSTYRQSYKDKTTGEIRTWSVWWIKYYRDGKAIRESSESDKESDAKRLLHLREGDVVRGAPVVPRAGKVKFSELATDLVNEYKANGRRSLVDLEMRLDRHILPVFKEQRAANITTAAITKFITDRQAAGATNAEINRELAAIKRGYSLGMKGGKILSKPHIPMLKENNVRTGFFERSQFESVRDQLPEDLQPMVTFAYITGWRIPSEVLTLQWRQVDFAAGAVRLDAGTTKNNEAREFPFTAELREVLEGQKAEADELKRQGVISPWVFHREGRPIRTFRRSWLTACKNAGLPGRIPHDFRRTAVRNLVRAGIPERVAMQMTGHKTRSVFERYNIVSRGDLAEAAKKLDEVRRQEQNAPGIVSGIVAPFAKSARAVSD